MLWALVPLPREYVCEATNFAPKPMNPPPAGTGTSVHGRVFLLMAWRAETKPYRPLYVLTAEIGKPAPCRRRRLRACRFLWNACSRTNRSYLVTSVPQKSDAIFPCGWQGAFRKGLKPPAKPVRPSRCAWPQIDERFSGATRDASVSEKLQHPDGDL